MNTSGNYSDSTDEKFAQGMKQHNVFPFKASLGGRKIRENSDSAVSASKLGESATTNEGKLGTILSEEEDNSMPDFSREELNATLGQHKAELNAIASEMRREMAEWREQNNIQLSQLTIAINSLSSKIDGKMDRVDGEIKAIDGKIEGINGKFEGVQNQISGINTAISGIQSGISSRLAIFGIIIAVLVSLPGLISAFRDTPQSTQGSSTPPVIIQIPHASTQAVETPPSAPSTPKQPN